MGPQRAALAWQVSHTTRKPREGEQNGVHYHFVEEESMKADIAAGKFVEHALVHGTYYGTSKASIESAAQQGICILDIDVQGCQSVHALGWSNLAPLFVFISPPSMEALEARLTKRGTENAEKIAKRMETAKTEMEFIGSAEGTAIFDHTVVNEDLESAYALLKGCAHAPARAHAHATCEHARGLGQTQSGLCVGRAGASRRP